MEAELVRKEFEIFLRARSPETSIGNVDEIVLSYIAEVLCGLGESVDDEFSFDVQQFSEMVSAYVPEFTAVECSEVCEWVFDLVDKQWHKNKNEESGSTTENLNTETGSSYESGNSTHLNRNPPENVENEQMEQGSTPQPLSKQTAKKTSDRQNIQLSGTQAATHVCIYVPPTKLEQNDEKVQKKKGEHGQERRKDSKSNGTGNDEDIVLLTEMFPDISDKCLRSTHENCGGDMDETIQRLLEVAEQERQTEEKSNITVQQHRKTEMNDDKTLKEMMLDRYAYVDTEEDKVTHRPVLCKAEPKKLVRYRDSQVVNTKGERYTVLTRKDTEGENMKKTYINLNPLRKYRFH